MPLKTWLSRRENRNAAFLTAFFAVYMFEYMATLTFIDKGGALEASDGWRYSLHYIDCALVVLGFLLFAFLRRLPDRFRKFISPVSGAVYGVSVLLLYFLRDVRAYSAAAMCAALFLGVLGGMVYFCMSAALSGSPFMGRMMAAGGALAVIVQYIFQEFFDIAAGFPVMLVLGFAAVMYLVRQRPWEWLEEICLPYEAPDSGHSRALKKTLIFLCVCTVCLECIGAVYDRQMVLLNVQNGYNGYNLYAWPRLMSAVGYLIVGFLYDLSKGRLLCLTVVCMALLAILNPLLFGQTRFYAFNMCVFYVFIGSCVSFYNLAFWQTAPKTRWPELCSGMGRVVSNLVGFVLLPVPLERLSMTGSVIAVTALLGIMLVAMAFGGGLSLEKEKPKEEPITREKALKIYSETFGLTPREGEVLEKLLFSETGMQELADELAISRRVLQRYSSSIYEKTGMQSRHGLFQSYVQLTGDIGRKTD